MKYTEEQEEFIENVTTIALVAIMIWAVCSGVVA